MKLFDRLTAFIEQLPKALENLATAIRDAAKRESGEDQIPSRVTAEIRFPREVEDAQTSAQNEQIRIQRRIARWTALAFVAAAGYACIAIQQWHEMQKQNVIQRNASMLTERAWVILSFGSFAFSDPDAKGFRTFAVQMETKNVGKTPAKNIFAEIVVDTFPNDGTWKARYKDQATRTQIANLMLADGVSKFSAPLQHNTDHGFVKTLLSESEWKHLTDGDSYVVTFGRMTYMDSFGRWHWQHFCSWADLASDKIAGQNCTAYNDMDEANLNDDGDEGPPKNEPYILDGIIHDPGKAPMEFATKQ